ncbi:MAG: hypothetical protein NTW79_00515 [Candidatus Berkelbacteria bacterium]|nr:hypothetical protein [Candidatus Berkelbacteria bacterium]
MRKHLAIFIGPAIEKILVGEKAVDGRFSRSRVLPFCAVAKNDIIYLKESAGDIVGQVVVDNVLYYENLNPKSIKILRREYGESLKTDDKFWQAKSKSRFATLVFLKKPERFLTPMKFKKKDRRPWLVID